MKILQIVFHLSSGGAEKFTVNLSNELAKSNEVYLCSIQNDQEESLSFFKSEISPNVNYINLGRTRALEFLTFFRIGKLINRINPDIIHCHLNTKIYLYLWAIVYHKKIKIIHTIHNLAQKDVGFRWQKSLNKFFYRRKLFRGIVISKQCLDSFSTFYGNTEVILIENGVSQESPSPCFNDVKSEIESYKHDADSKVFIHIARFHKQKNQELLIKVFNRIQKDKLNAILLIIGAGFDSNAGIELKNKSESGIFYLGKKHNVSDYLMNSDAFILSSHWEGLPISLIEAASYGVIPVSTPAGGVRDFIRNRSIGFLSKDFSEDELYNSAVNCIDEMDHFDRSKLTTFYATNYSIQICAKKYFDLYQSSIGL